jgi:hypothetical protein
MKTRREDLIYVINKIITYEKKIKEIMEETQRNGVVVLERSIWPDVDGPEGVNEFLKGMGVKVSFLLDSGIKFEYDPSKFDPYKIGEGTLYLQDPITKDNLFHYYEDIGGIVFENLVTKEKYTIPIYDDWTEIGLAGD